MTNTITSYSEHDTIDAGRQLGSTLAPGAVVLLCGDLGAGKTAFVRGLAEGLGVDGHDVSSPTFMLIQEYRGGRLQFYHVDLYRLEHARETDDLGLDELGNGAVVAIEWAEKLPRSPRAAIRVTIAEAENEMRRITIDTPNDE